MTLRWPAVLTCASLLLAQRAAVEDAWDLMARGDRKQAVALLRRIIQGNPADADARLLLGSVLQEEGERAESIAQLSEAVRLRPQSAEAHNALGEALYSFKEIQPARAEFEKATLAEPGFAQAHVNLGLVLLESGEPPRAAEHLDRAIALLGRTPDSAYPRYLRAKAYAEAGEIEKAAAELKEAVTLRPDFVEAWSDLGQARKLLLDDAGALSAFERAVALGAGDAVAQYRLGSEYLRQGKPRLAIPHLQTALRLRPEDQSTLNSLQAALRQEGRVQEADQVKQKLSELLRRRDKVRQNALTAIQLNNEGAQLEKSGRLRSALEKYRAALELDPEHVGIRVNFAAALLHTGKWRQGIAELREAVRRDPGNLKLKQTLEAAIAKAPKQ